MLSVELAQRVKVKVIKHFTDRLVHFQVLRASKEGDKETVYKLSKPLKLHLDSDDREKEGKEFMRTVMKKWLPAADSMIDMIENHLPSPDVAQQYRTEMLYEGPLDDPVGTGMFTIFRYYLSGQWIQVNFVTLFSNLRKF